MLLTFVVSRRSFHPSTLLRLSGQGIRPVGGHEIAKRKVSLNRITGPEEEAVAGRGHLRAAHADTTAGKVAGVS